MAAGVLSTIILSSAWSPSEFGYWAYISAVAGMASALDFGLAIYAGSLSQNSSEKWQDYCGEKGRIFILAIMAAGFASLLLNSISALAARYIYVGSDVVSITGILQETCMGLVGAKMISNIGLAALAGQGRYSLLLLISLCQSISLLMLSIGTVAFDLGIAGNLNALSILNFAWAVIISCSATYEKNFYCFRKGNKNWEGSINNLLITAKKSCSLFPSSFSSSCFSYLDKIIVGATVGAQSLAFYTIASTVASQINSVAGLITQPVVHLAPMRSTSAQAKQNLDGYAEMSLIICPLIGLILVLLSPTIGKIFFPNLVDVSEILSASRSIGAMSFVYSLYSLNCYGHFYWLANKKYSFVSMVGVISSFGTLGAMLFVKGVYGLFGLIACNLVYSISILLTVTAIRDNDSRIRLGLFLGCLMYGSSILLLASTWGYSPQLGLG